MSAVLFNCATVLLGGVLGMLVGDRLPRRVTDAVMRALGLCTLSVAISGLLKGENALVSILAMALGTGVGTALDLDGKLERGSERLTRRFKAREGKPTVGQGLIAASLLFCIGSMAFVGSISAGLGDSAMLNTKSIIDMCAAFALASAMGLGVPLSALAILVFQGALALLAGVLEPLMAGTVLGELTCTGSLLMLAIGFNLVGITKLKTADMLPALLFAPLLCKLLPLIGLG